MSASIASRFAGVFVALGLSLFAGSARAQFAECVSPANVPGEVFDTILDQASFDFGDLSEKVCKSIVKKGVATCKAQVKAADKCFRRAFDANYAISVKQCEQLSSKEERSDCKAEAKSIRDEGKSDVSNSKESGLSVCDGEFEEALSGQCLGMVPG